MAVTDAIEELFPLFRIRRERAYGRSVRDRCPVRDIAVDLRHEGDSRRGPDPIEGNVTVLLFPDPPHTPPPVELQETNVVVAGRLSVTVTLLAVSGPLLATVKVYVMFEPTITGLGEAA